jgi:hypothetical protein
LFDFLLRFWRTADRSRCIARLSQSNFPDQCRKLCGIGLAPAV